MGAPVLVHACRVSAIPMETFLWVFWILPMPLQLCLFNSSSQQGLLIDGNNWQHNSVTIVIQCTIKMHQLGQESNCKSILKHYFLPWTWSWQVNLHWLYASKILKVSIIKQEKWLNAEWLKTKTLPHGKALQYTHQRCALQEAHAGKLVRRLQLYFKLHSN